jgi:oligoendopeptidase F
MKTSWDLSLLYSSLDDSRLEADMTRAERLVKKFEKKWKGEKTYLTSARVLKTALDEHQTLIETSGAAPYLYAMYRKVLDTSDKAAEALMARLDERHAKMSVALEFFLLSLGKIRKEKQKEFLKSVPLKPYKHFLEKIFEHAEHDLTEAEEKILTLTGDVRRGRWTQLTDNILHAKTVSWKDETLPLPKAQNLIHTLRKEDRRALHALVNEVYRDVAPVAEAEINALYTDKKVMDELRGYKTPYEASVKGYDNSLKSINALVEAVQGSYPLAHRFFAHKAKLLGEKTITYADRGARIGNTTKTYSFEEASAIVREAFGALKPEYGEIFDRLLENGQVDVFPKIGKEGGAFCSSHVGTPTYVLLNHIDDVHSLMTLAHEMGHAIHAERSKTQPPIYQGHSTAVAETASTFFEQVAFDALLSTLPPEDRVIATHDHLQDAVGTVFRQIACFRMEEAMHREVREKGYVSKERFVEIHNEHMRACYGPSVTLTPEDGYFFVTWSHIRNFFYVYTYAYGLLISRALYAGVKKDPRAIDAVDAFLSAGQSMSPKQIFKTTGLDVESPEFWKKGLMSIEKDLEEFESMNV